MDSPRGRDEVVVEVSNAFVKYGRFVALKGVSLSLRRGERVLIMGPNGSGKTTLLKLILGLVKPVKGSVKVFGYSPRSLPLGYRRRIAFASERAYLPPNLRVRDYVSIALDAYGVEDQGWVARVLSSMGLDEVESKRIGALSQGFRKRVGIAVALAVKPSLLLLDEPYANVDPVTRVVIDRVVDELGKGVTTIIASHVPPTRYLRIDRIVALSSGRIVWCGSTEVKYVFRLRCIDKRIEVSDVRELEELIRGDCSIEGVDIEDPYTKAYEVLAREVGT